MTTTSTMNAIMPKAIPPSAVPDSAAPDSLVAAGTELVLLTLLRLTSSKPAIW